MNWYHIICLVSALAPLAVTAPPTLAEKSEADNDTRSSEWELVAPKPNVTGRAGRWLNGNYPSPMDHHLPGSIEAAEEDSKRAALDRQQGLGTEWEEWHKQVAIAVRKTVQTKTSAFPHSKSLTVVAMYTVTHAGQVVNAHLTESSTNLHYNKAVLDAINSLNDNVALLEFPPGSHRLVMDMMDTFTRR